MGEVAIVSAVRTAIAKGGRGSLKDTRPDDLLGAVLKDAVARAGAGPHAPRPPPPAGRVADMTT